MVVRGEREGGRESFERCGGSFEGRGSAAKTRLEQTHTQKKKTFLFFFLLLSSLLFLLPTLSSSEEPWTRAHAWLCSPAIWAPECGKVREVEVPSRRETECIHSFFVRSASRLAKEERRAVSQILMPSSRPCHSVCFVSSSSLLLACTDAPQSLVSVELIG